LISISEDIKGGSSKSANHEALTVDWGGLSDSEASFLAFVVHAFSMGDSNGGNLSEVKGCKVSCEWKGEVFFGAECNAPGPGFFWGFAFKDDQGQWWFIEMNASVSGFK